MTEPKTYGTPAAFKVALEDRLKRRATAGGVHVNRLRQRFVMERFLARVQQEIGAACVLKGGLALELRITEARSTKDIDVRVVGDADAIIGQLQRAAPISMNDYLSYRVGRAES